jgi:hypothetical protein
MRLRILRNIFSILASVLTLFIHDSVKAEQRYPDQSKNCNPLQSDKDYTVSDVVISGYSASASLLTEIKSYFQPGTKLSASAVLKESQKVRTLVSRHFEEEETDQSQMTIYAGEMLVEICDTSINDESKALVKIKPYSITLSLRDGLENTLKSTVVRTPAGRLSVTPSISGNSLALSAGADRNYGPSVSLAYNADLDLESNQKPQNDGTYSRLSIEAGARKSLSESFYNSDALASYTRGKLGHLQTLSLKAAYQNSKTPIGDEREWNSAGRIAVDLSKTFLTSTSPKVSLGVVARSSSSSVSSSTNLNGDDLSQSEYALSLYNVASMKVGSGVGRIGLWGDAAAQINSQSYQRAAVLASFDSELGNSHNTFGFSLQAGAATSWGAVPVVSQYFAGNPPSFFSDSFNNLPPLQFPRSPILRSVGEYQAGVIGNGDQIIGATKYLNASLTVAIPVKGWSRPVFPDITIYREDVGLPPMKLGDLIRDLMKKRSKIGVSILVDRLLRQGMTQAQAQQRANHIVFNEFHPIIDETVDRLNLYSVRPILVSDFAQMSSSIDGSTAWLGVGGGLQANFLNTSLEMGYMQTVAPVSRSSVGNFFARFTIKNLF